VFGLRYHVASLAAVFLALAIGVLLGVAISGKVSEAEESFEQQRIDELEQDLEDANARADAADQRGEATRELVERAYPALMENRLEDRGFTLVFLGPVDGNIRDAVERALSDADSGSPVRVVALEAPVDGPELQNRLEGDEFLASYAGEAGDFGELGEELGRELVEGGETPLWSALSSELVEETSGSTAPEADGAVVVSTWTPPSDGGDGDADGEAAMRATETLVDGLVRGLDSSGLPVVGAATTLQETSLIERYRDWGISSVDNIDTDVGRLGLALLLAGGRPGHYGFKETASNGVVPPVDPVVPPEGG
jgi:Copper transport outer membrane protein, MctB